MYLFSGKCALSYNKENTDGGIIICIRKMGGHSFSYDGKIIAKKVDGLE